MSSVGENKGLSLWFMLVLSTMTADLLMEDMMRCCMFDKTPLSISLSLIMRCFCIDCTTSVLQPQSLSSVILFKLCA